MNQVLMSTLSGLLVGGLFSLLNLPIPAPPSISGVMGIVGIYLGFVMANALV